MKDICYCCGSYLADDDEIYTYLGEIYCEECATDNINTQFRESTLKEKAELLGWSYMTLDELKGYMD